MKKKKNLSYDFRNEIDNPEMKYKTMKKKGHHVSISLDDYFINDKLEEESEKEVLSYNEIYLEIEKTYDIFLSVLLQFNSIQNQWNHNDIKQVDNISNKKDYNEFKKRNLKINGYFDTIFTNLTEINSLIHNQTKQNYSLHNNNQMTYNRSKISLNKKEQAPFIYNPPLIKNKNNSLLSIYKDISKYKHK